MSSMTSMSSSSLTLTSMSSEMDKQTNMVDNAKAKVKIDMKSGIVELNHYWPHGIKKAGKETNPNLLYLFSKKWPRELKCNCVDSGSTETEIKREVIYEREKLIQRFPNEMESDTCLKGFCESLISKEEIRIRNNFICGKCSGPLSEIILPEYLDYTPITIFLQGRKFFFYLDLEVAKRIPMPSSVASDLSKCFEKLLKLGKFATSEHNFGEDYEMESSNNNSGAPFGLKKADKQTINWMKTFESRRKTKTEGNTIMKRRFSDFTIKLGDSGLYLNKLENLTTTPRPSPTESKQLRINTGILTGLLDEKKRRQTIIGAIRSNEMSLKKKQSRIDGYKKKFPDYLTSNATIIVCLRSKLKKWISRIEKDFKDSKMVNITNKDENENYSCDDVINADIVLTTYEHLSKYPVIRHVSDRERLDKKEVIPFKFFQFRRLIYDNLSKKTKYFFEKYHKRGLKMNSDFVWGIVDSSSEFKKSFFNSFICEYLYYPEFMKHHLGLKQYLNTGKFVKNHESDSSQSEYIEETLMIEMNTEEKRFANGEIFLNLSNTAKLKACFIKRSSSNNCDGADFNEVYAEKLRNSLTKMKEIEAKIEVERALYNLNLKDRGQILSEEKFVEKFSELFKRFNDAKSKYNFKNNCFNDLKTNFAGQKCPICLDQIPDYDLGMADCCHVFCHDCGKEYFEKNEKCPLCLEIGSLRLIKKYPVADEFLRKHGWRLMTPTESTSRLEKVACYIKDVLKYESNPIMVLYVKNRIQKEVAKSLLEMIRKFDKVDSDSKFIILTKRDFRIPRQLKNATHFLILQPFLGVSKAVEAEQDGISSVNCFNRKKPLTIVRFALKDTIEEKLLIKAQRYREMNAIKKH